MHKHTLSLLAITISATTLHNNASAALRRLPAAVQSVRHALRSGAALTRQFSSRRISPTTVESQQYVSTAHHGYKQEVKHQNPLKIALKNENNNIAQAEKKAVSIELLDAVKANDQQRVIKAIELDHADFECYIRATEHTTTADTFAPLFKKMQEYNSDRCIGCAVRFIYDRASGDEISILWHSYRDFIGESFLSLFWLAAAQKKGITAETLKNAHIDINARYGWLGVDCLSLALLRRDKHTTASLLNSGADPNSNKNIFGSTVLYEELHKHNNEDIVKMLVEAGAHF